MAARAKKEDYGRSQALLEQSMAQFQAMGDTQNVILSLVHLGHITYKKSEYQRATVLFRDGLVRAWDRGDMWNVAGCLEGLAAVAGAKEKPERATRLFAAAEALNDDIGAARQRHDRASYDRDVAAIRTAMGEEAFAAVWAAGRALSPEQAVDEALTNPIEAV